MKMLQICKLIVQSNNGTLIIVEIPRGDLL